MLKISNTLTNIRIIATLVIVLYHCSCPYYAWNWNGYLEKYPVGKYISIFFLHILSDTMLPTFFMISGILLYSRINSYMNIRQAIWRKFDRLCIPLAIITTICVWLKTLGLHNDIDGHLWFIEVLFIYFLLSFTFFRFRVSPKYHFIAAIFMHGIYIYLSKKGITLPWELSHILQYYFFFTGGHYINLYQSILKQNIYFKVSILIIMILCWILGVQTFYTIFFNLTLISWVSNKEIKNTLLKNLNTYSFSIYLLHHPIIIGLFYHPFFQKLYAHEALFSITLMFIIAFSLTIFLTISLRRLGFKYF